MDYAMQADATATFIGLKQGMFTGQGKSMTGMVFYDGLGVEKVGGAVAHPDACVRGCLHALCAPC